MSRKPPLKERFLDRVPLFGAYRRLMGWTRRNRGWIYLGLAVAVLFVVRPVLVLASEIFKVLAPAVSAVLDNPMGRVVFYNVLGVLLLWWVWRRVRASALRVIGLWALRDFLDGLHAMILGRWRAAIRSFERVVRRGRWFRLEDAVPEHRDVLADARVKIAACHLRLGETNAALRWLHSVREQDILTDHVRRHHAELRALTYDASDELEAETILRELERTQARDRDNRRVLIALRDRAEAAGDLRRTREIARRLVAASEGEERAAAERDLALLEYRAARQALGAGEGAGTARNDLVRALQAHPGDVKSALLLGDLALAEGDVRGALRAWSRAVGLPVFDRLAKLLEDGKLQGDREMELLKSHFPYAGTMLVLAEHHRKRGDPKRARAALDKVLAQVGESFPVLRAYAACLEAEGDAAGAAALYRRALTLLG